MEDVVTDVATGAFPPDLLPLPGLPGVPPPPGAAGPMTVDQVSAALAQAAPTDPPVIEDTPEVTVELPGGWLRPDGRLERLAIVRELNGFDEERLSRLNGEKNPAVYVTELLALGVESIGGDKPSKDVIRSLLIGDRDALVLGIRQATYGNLVPFTLHCPACETDSDVNVELDTDVKVIEMADPLERVFTVPLRRGSAQVGLLTGVAQEAFSENIGKRTQAEINTIMMSKSVISINGSSVNGNEDRLRALSALDRETIMKFIAEHQPGPQLGEIQVPCATCGAEYPVSLGLPTLFRF